jgi:hypothetical protein
LNLIISKNCSFLGVLSDFFNWHRLMTQFMQMCCHIIWNVIYNWVYINHYQLQSVPSLFNLKYLPEIFPNLYLTKYVYQAHHTLMCLECLYFQIMNCYCINHTPVQHSNINKWIVYVATNTYW